MSILLVTVTIAGIVVVIIIIIVVVLSLISFCIDLFKQWSVSVEELSADKRPADI